MVISFISVIKCAAILSKYKFWLMMVNTVFAIGYSAFRINEFIKTLKNKTMVRMVSLA